jgi:uncharacterized protein (TIGR00299 family) protein
MPRTLHIDMPSGVAGDMLLAALIACGGDRERLERDLAGLGVGPIRIAVETVMAGPLAALRARVDAEQEPRWIQAPATLRPAAGHGHGSSGGHQHRPYAAIRDLLAAAPLPERVRTRAQRCFRLLAEAEASVHGVPPETVEFHEVGSLDAIADVVGCCLLLEQLAIDRVVAGSIMPGRGTVRCAHGLMPVPVPAVAAMLRATGAPVRFGDGEPGELTTPTGCALVCGLADAFAAADAGRVVAIGAGAGSKRIPGLVNAVRCAVVETAEAATGDEACVELAANLDDMTGEDLALAAARLLALGALDAWIAPVLMKKGRPGQVLHVLARAADRERLAEAMLAHTSSLGVRWHAVERRVLPRHERVIAIAGRSVRLKLAAAPGGERWKPEADDVAALAEALAVPVAEARRRIAVAVEAGEADPD